MKHLLESLREAESISMQEVINYFNELDKDYTGWDDLQMIIY